MIGEHSDCFYINQTDGTLIRFCYEMEQGIYYQIRKKQKWSERICVYKNCFAYFYVLCDWMGRIYVFCQEISGDIILCSLEEVEWRFEILVSLDIIMPRYLRAFYFNEDLHLLYHIVDKNTNLDVLMYQNSKTGHCPSPRMISIFDSYKRFPYSIYCDSSRNIALMYMNSILSNEYQLYFTTYHTANDKWEKKEVLHTSKYPFLDYSFFAEQNWKHFLYLTQENQKRRIIYRNKLNEISKERVLFQHNLISSCLLLKFNKEIFALWTCDGILYGCYSCNHGLDFGNIIVYQQFKKTSPVKVFYQKIGTKNDKKSIPYEQYLVSYQGEEQLLLPNLIQDYQYLHEIPSFS